MGSYLGAGAPPSPFLLSRLVLPLPQEAYGESDWRDLGPMGSAPLPSSSVPDGALRDTQALLRSLLAGNQDALTALLQCWAPLGGHFSQLYSVQHSTHAE